MKALRRRLEQAVVVLVGASLLLGETNGQTLLEIRHRPPDLDRVADSVYPEFSESALLSSPCNPEEDGYFGGTFGDPVVFEYVFELETSIDADTPRALDVIRNHVVDVVVTDTFPQLCAVHRRRLRESRQAKQSQITGFKFDKLPQIDLEGTKFSLIREHCVIRHLLRLRNSPAFHQTTVSLCWMKRTIVESSKALLQCLGTNFTAMVL